MTSSQAGHVPVRDGLKRTEALPDLVPLTETVGHCWDVGQPSLLDVFG